jgi:predicted nucleic acid-binding protein
VNWQQLGDLIIYLIDTDVLVRIHDKKDSVAIYKRLITMAAQGDLKTVRQVFDELGGHGPQYKLLGPHKNKFIIPAEEQYSAEVQKRIEILGAKAKYLWVQTGGKNPDPADPWLVAVASARKYTLVTNERQISTARIPAACKIPETQCRCITGPHFLHEVGIVTTINPAHISVSAFFDDKN